MKASHPLSKRTLARKLACDILYQMDLTGEDLEEVTKGYRRMLREGIEETLASAEGISETSEELLRVFLGDGSEIKSLEPPQYFSWEPPRDIPEFSLRLVELFLGNRSEIEDLISSYADRWSLQRMPMVDRNLLRLGFTELLYKEDIPTNVTINEYLELAKAFSTEDSGKFINGVMGKLVDDKGLDGEVNQ
ncbi:MAG: transcription antitermination factor NusB [Actinomycetota bacterium]|nr:transcription antitermination factor NusB [Actinomycetota bacterium]